MKSDNGRVLIGQAGSFVHLLALPPPRSLCPETPANCITNAGQLPDPVPFYPAPHIPCILEYILHFSFFSIDLLPENIRTKVCKPIGT